MEELSKTRKPGRPRVFERELRVNFTAEQVAWLEKEAHRLGLYLTDVVRSAVADKLQASQ